jgi:hypothetical protein
MAYVFAEFGRNGVPHAPVASLRVYPTNVSADQKSGTCPSGFVFKPGILYTCNPGMTCSASWPATCVSAVSGGPVTSDEIKRGDSFFSIAPCPQGYVKSSVGTKSEGCRRSIQVPPFVSPSLVPPPIEATPPLSTECQTGYVLIAGQCTKPIVSLPLEVKSAGVTSWASTNWKWLAALAVVGVVGYGWAKRKPVET